MRSFTLLLTVLALTVSAAYAQDPVKVDPQHYKVEFENEHVRALRITYGPGEKSIMHEHPAGVAVILVDGTFRMTLPGGKMQPGKNVTQGAAIWTPATTHLPEDVGKTTAEPILVELKSPVAQRP